MKIRFGFASFMLVGGPVLCGALLFLLLAPHPESGVYVLNGRMMGAVPAYSAGANLAFADVSRTAVAAPRYSISGDRLDPVFFLVGTEDSLIGAQALLAKAYVFVVDHAVENAAPELMPVPATIQRVNPRIVRVSSPEFAWDEGSAGRRHYRDVLSRTGSRSTLEALGGVVIDDPATGLQRLYSIRIGPQ